MKQTVSVSAVSGSTTTVQQNRSWLWLSSNRMEWNLLLENDQSIRKWMHQQWPDEKISILGVTCLWSIQLLSSYQGHLFCQLDLFLNGLCRHVYLIKTIFVSIHSLIMPLVTSAVICHNWFSEINVNILTHQGNQQVLQVPYTVNYCWLKTSWDSYVRHLWWKELKCKKYAAN